MSKSKRTHPLDRDGDGDPGGSLPGNQTAPMADDALDAIAQAEPDLVEQVRADDDAADPMLDPVDPLDGADDDTRAAIEGQLRPISDDHVHVPSAAEADAAERPDDLGVDRTETFDAEQVAAAQSEAGEGAVIAEEGETVADPAAATAPADLAQVDDGDRRVAVSVRDLRILTGAKRLYRSAEGYSANYGAPYIDQATVDVWLANGLAEEIPSAGNMGGVRATAQARQVLGQTHNAEAA